MTTKKKQAEVFKCDQPGCNLTFTTPKEWGKHRYYKHDIPGQSKGALRRAQIALEKKQGGGPGLKCPECPFVAKRRGGLTKHMNSAHPGVTTSPAPGDSLKCPECPFVAANRAGYSWHLKAQHGIDHTFKKEKKETQLVKRSTQAITLNGHIQEGPHAGTDPIPEATLALALGRFQEFSARIAIEHDLPPRTFTARLAGLIYATTLR